MGWAERQRHLAPTTDAEREQARLDLANYRLALAALPVRAALAELLVAAAQSGEMAVLTASDRGIIGGVVQGLTPDEVEDVRAYLVDTMTAAADRAKAQRAHAVVAQAAERVQ